jgi:DNA-binding GntR family transcriptional regulator
MSPVTEEQRVLDRLRALILAGALPQDEFLSQRKLALRAETSLVSLRGALRQLESEGLIQNVPRWGVRVPREGAQEIQDRYFMRETLEVAAVRRFAGCLEPAAARQLRALASACDAVGALKDPDAVERFVQAHLAFHRHIGACSGSPLLMAFLSRLNNRTGMALNARRGWARGRDRAGQHHLALAQILIRGDADRAEAAMREHIRRGLNNELESLNVEP